MAPEQVNMGAQGRQARAQGLQLGPDREPQRPNTLNTNLGTQDTQHIQNTQQEGEVTENEVSSSYLV